MRALNPSDMTEYWNDGGAGGNMSKFSPPMVADGLVMVATQNNGVSVYGLVSSSVRRGQSKMRGQAKQR